MPDAFDSELDDYYESLEERGECIVCGEDVPPKRQYCSKACYRADN